MKILYLAVLALGVAMAWNVLAPQIHARSNAATCDATWRVMKPPAPGKNYNLLKSISATTPDDVWAAGFYSDKWKGRPLLMHWNGNAWKLDALREFSQDNTLLNDVVALRHDNVWAAGSQDKDSLTLHWDGRQWTRVASPSPGTRTDINQMAAISADDIWAVGSAQQANGFSALALHWNGKRWKTVPVPDSGSNADFLYKISARASDDAWAMGEAEADSLLLHWNGTAWTIVEYANTHDINDVAAVAPNDVWAVGYTWDASQVIPYIQRWNGAVWVPLDMSFLGPNKTLHDVYAIAENDIWILGREYESDKKENTFFALHWNGLEWQVTSFEDKKWVGISGLTADSDKNLWALAHYPDRSRPIRYGLNERTRLVAPADGWRQTGPVAQLTWRQGECASQYEIQVYADAPNGVLVERARVETTSLQVGPRPHDTSYFWRVRGCTSARCGIWSRWRSFQILGTR